MDIVRPAISALDGYTPGEQPQTDGWTKLNTNENPYPPSPRIAAAVSAATPNLQIYPDPDATSFREAASRVYNVDPDWILPANGSDENLTILLRTFVDPHETISYPYPGYVLYETLGNIQGCKVAPMILDAGWRFTDENLKQAAASKLVLLPNPNSPSGTLWQEEQVRQLLPNKGILVLDGAYADFADPAQDTSLLSGDLHRHIVMTRTLSKSYSLAGLRFGFAIAHPDRIREMRKVKDSYNCDSLAIAAATAAMEDQEWMQTNRRRILDTRARAQAELTSLGFQVNPSQANFLWMTHPDGQHKEIYEQLKDRRILIRYMRFPLVQSEDSEFDGLRVSIGTDDQIDLLLSTLKEIV